MALFWTMPIFWSIPAYSADDLPIKTRQVAQADNAEIEFWQSVKSVKDPAELEAYLKAYPQGRFAPRAKIRMNRLKDSAKPITVRRETLTKTTASTLGIQQQEITVALGPDSKNPSKASLGVQIANFTIDVSSALGIPVSNAPLVISTVNGSGAHKSGIVT